MTKQKVCECEEPIVPKGTSERSPFFFCQSCSRIRKQTVLCLCGCGRPVEFPASRVPGHGALLPELASFFSPSSPAGRQKICVCEEPEPLYLVQEGDYYFQCKSCGGIREPAMPQEASEPYEFDELLPLCECGCKRSVKISRKTGLPNRFVHGHSGKEPAIEILCSCGCGQRVRFSEELQDWPRRLSGHRNKI